MKIVEMENSHLNYVCKNLNDFDEFWTVFILQNEFKNENSKYFVLENDDGSVLGFAGLWFNVFEAHVMNIAVDRSYRRNGYGSELLEFLIKFAKRMEKELLTLEVRDDNLGAIKLYKKFDFEVVGRRKKYYEGKTDAIIMTRYFENGA